MRAEKSAPWSVQAIVKILDGVLLKLKCFGPIEADAKK